MIPSRKIRLSRDPGHPFFVFADFVVDLPSGFLSADRSWTILFFTVSFSFVALHIHTWELDVARLFSFVAPAPRVATGLRCITPPFATADPPVPSVSRSLRQAPAARRRCRGTWRAGVGSGAEVAAAIQGAVKGSCRIVLSDWETLVDVQNMNWRAGRSPYQGETGSGF